MIAARNVEESAAGAILDRLTQLYPKAIDLSLDRIRRLMDDLGAPQDRLPPVFHVAGTNGKGSTVAFLRAALEAAGRRVHVYTSPHLVRFNERIRVAGTLISDAELAAILTEVEEVNAGRPITFFEVTTAAAFLAFARNPAEAVVLETGMGGRLDATNLVERPAVCAIAPISLDHTEYLGPTIGAIAREKAGILKPGIPAAIGPQPDEAGAVFDEVAAAIGAKLSRFGREWSIAETASGCRFIGERRIELPRPALRGRHQIFNAGLAVAALCAAEGAAIDDSALRQGIRSAEWPARLQRLSQGKLVSLVPPWTAIFLDGGHNESAGAALAEWAAEGGTALDLVFAMRANKAVDRFFGYMAPHVARLRAVAIPGDALSMAPDAIVAAARAAGVPEAAASDSVEDAVADLARAGDRTRPILICGSLYLAGKVLETNG